MKRSPVVALSLLLCLAAVARAGNNVFYLGDERVVVLRFNVQIDGRDAQAIWDEYLDKRFAGLDADRDGELTGEELNGIPSYNVLRQMGVAVQVANALPVIVSGSHPMPDHLPRDGKVTRKELGEYYRNCGLESFRIRMDAGNTTAVRVTAAAVAGRTGTDDSAKILFEKLDPDGDGLLAAEDFRSAQHLLRKLDLDRDELISSNELVQLANIFGVVATSGAGAQPVMPKFLSLSSGPPMRAVAQQFMTARDGHRGEEKNNRLSVAELGIAADRLETFDADSDGSLDFEELQQWLMDPPADVELRVRLGKREPGQAALEFTGGIKGTVGADLVSLTLGLVQMGFALGDVGYVDPRARGAALEESVGRNFKQADTDNNGYLEPNEGLRLGLSTQIFTLLDTDKDGKLFLKEYTDFYLPQAEMQQARASLDISERGRDLFRILDTNNDGRLGPREFEAGIARISAWDGNGDGKLAMTEIPQQFRLSVGRGTVTSTGRVVLASPASRPVITPRPAAAGSPAWFAKMDRNGDGDVSRREFLGPAEMFARFDTDANGLLDLQEAIAAEK